MWDVPVRSGIPERRASFGPCQEEFGLWAELVWLGLTAGSKGRGLFSSQRKMGKQGRELGDIHVNLLNPCKNPCKSMRHNMEAGKREERQFWDVRFG